MGGRPPASKTRHTYILVMVDKFSKYVLLEGCPEGMTAEDTAQIVLTRVIAHFGLPQVVLSDRGPQFTSVLWRMIFRALGSKVALAASHHPQTDGQTERAIQTLLRLIRTYAAQFPSEWERQLPVVQFALNNAPATASRFSPFQILFGVSPIVPLDFC